MGGSNRGNNTPIYTFSRGGRNPRTSSANNQATTGFYVQPPPVSNEANHTLQQTVQSMNEMRAVVDRIVAVLQQNRDVSAGRSSNAQQPRASPAVPMPGVGSVNSQMQHTVPVGQQQ